MSNVVEQHQGKVADLCRRTGARRLDVFGPTVRADFAPSTSDLDFVVELEDLPPADYAQAYFKLKEGLESLFGRPVDLVTDSSLANPYFRDRIASEQQPAEADCPRRIEQGRLSLINWIATPSLNQPFT